MNRVQIVLSDKEWETVKINANLELRYPKEQMRLLIVEALRARGYQLSMPTNFNIDDNESAIVQPK